MLEESSQKAPRAASESVIRRMALTATRPARRRSLSASPSRKPNTGGSALVLDEPAVLERQRPLLERGGQRGLVRGEEHCRAARPDVAHDLDDLARHALVEVA